MRGERRMVTVLFADVIGFTSICEQLDPEQVRSLMNDCLGGVAAVIQQEGGYIDKFIGDAVMALFGAPVAHEDDPRRACRAALAMQEFLGGFSERCRRQTKVTLRMRVGLHTGLVVAGEIGLDTHKEYSVLGDSVNIAARLQSAAPPDCVLVSRQIWQQTHSDFEFGIVRHLALKGKRQAVEVYELLRAQRATGPPIERRATPLLGRATELRRLLMMWESAVGQSAWIEIRGETGLGKTELIREAEKRIRGKRLLTIEVTPEAGRRPFGLLQLILHSVVRDLSGKDSQPDSREVFVHTLVLLSDELNSYADALWYLAAPARLVVLAPEADPQSLRRTIERGVTTLLEQLAKRHPNLALFIDSYGLADDASAEFLESLGARPEGWPLPMIVAMRFGRRQSLRPDAVLTLHPLSDDDMEEVLNRAVPDQALPQSTVTELVHRAAGVPLFLMELLQTLVERGVLARGPAGFHLTPGRSVGTIDVPASMQATVLARIDQLAPETRALLRECAVQGQEFSLELVDHMRQSGGQLESVASSMAELERRGFVRAIDGATQRWVFRYPAIQECCYETMLMADRQRLHGQVMRALCAEAGGRQSAAPELLAHHAQHAQEWGVAAEAHLRVGHRQSGLFLNDTAAIQYERVLQSIERLEVCQDQDHLLVTSALAGLAQLSMRTGHYAAAREHARRMRNSARQIDLRLEADRLEAVACMHTGSTSDAERMLKGVLDQGASATHTWPVRQRAHYDLADLYARDGRLQDALEHLQSCRGGETSDPHLSIQCDMLEGKVLHAAGKFQEALTTYRQVSEVAAKTGSLSEQARAMNNLGNVARDLGQYREAEQQFTRALEQWERTGDTECIAGVRTNLGNLAMSEGDFVAAREHHQHALTACSAIGNVRGIALAHANLAILALEAGESESAVRSAREALVMLGDEGHAWLRGLVLAVYGEGQLECGQTQQAEQIFESLLAQYDEVGHPLARAGGLRGRGRQQFMQGHISEAILSFVKAVELYDKIERTQEAARTRLFLAEALWRAGQVERGREELERARRRFALLRAGHDAERADRLLREMTGKEGAHKRTKRRASRS
jgi:class 3 adenylate cyclase/tetratricopeptide (TPR) repeat protein